MATHSTRRIIANAARSVTVGASPPAGVQWSGLLSSNAMPPAAPADTYEDGAEPAVYVTWEPVGSSIPAHVLGDGIPATGPGTVRYQTVVQFGAGDAWHDTLDEWFRDLLDGWKTSGDGSVVFITDVPADAPPFFNDFGQVVRWQIDAQVVGDFS